MGLLKKIARKVVGGPVTLGSVAKKIGVVVPAIVPGGGVAKVVASGILKKGPTSTVAQRRAVQPPSAPASAHAVPFTGQQASLTPAAAAQAVQTAFSTLSGGTPTTGAMGIRPMGGTPSPDDSIYDTADRMMGGFLPGGPISPLGPNRSVSMGAAPAPSSGGNVIPYQNGNVPVVVAPIAVRRLVAPQGYVLVRGPNNTQLAMLKAVAYALGFKKRPRKGGGLSSREVRSARKVQRFVMDLTTGRKPKSPIKAKKGGR